MNCRICGADSNLYKLMTVGEANFSLCNLNELQSDVESSASVRAGIGFMPNLLLTIKYS